MFLIERPIDLFTLPKEYMLAHCISADYVLGAGIARQFRTRYRMNMWLRMTGTTFKWGGVGRCVIINLTDDFKMTTAAKGIFRVANLVTKEAFWHKPTHKAIRESLISLRNQLMSKPDYKNVHRIGMPRIACGLDSKKWTDIRQIIEEVFDNTEYEICVCTGEI